MYNCHFLDFIGQLFLLLAQRRPQFIVLCAPGVIKHRICKVLGLVVVTCLDFTIDWDDSWYLEGSRTYWSFMQPILREEVYKVQSHKSCRCSVSLSPWTFDWSQGIWCRPSFRLPTLSKSFQRFCCKSKDVVVIQLHKLWNKRSNNLCGNTSWIPTLLESRSTFLYLHSLVSLFVKMSPSPKLWGPIHTH